MPINILNIMTYFFIYGFLGWVLEVAYHAVAQNKLVNRGFLNGAICPIYGIGMVMLIILLEPVADNLVLLFAGAVIVCSALEFVTGFILEKLFRTRWWDYSEEKFNLGGYICLKFSLYWGIAGIIAVKVIHGGIHWAVNQLPESFIGITVVILCILLVMDVAATVIDITGFNKDLTSIDEMGEMIKYITDNWTDKIYAESKEMASRFEERKPAFEGAVADGKAEAEKIRKAIEEKREKLYSNMSRGQKRLIKAYPGLVSIIDNETVVHIKNKVLNFKEEKKKTV